MNRKIIQIGLVTSLLISGAAFAHGGATGIVKQRMDDMSMMSKAMKTIGLMIRGKNEYDGDQVIDAAKTIQMHGGEALLKKFPEGEIKSPSEATPEIWEDWSTFSKLANDLVLYAKAMEAAAPRGLMVDQEAIADADLADIAKSFSELSAQPINVSFKLTSKTCASCHAKFRQ